MKSITEYFINESNNNFNWNDIKKNLPSNSKTQYLIFNRYKSGEYYNKYDVCEFRDGNKPEFISTIKSNHYDIDFYANKVTSEMDSLLYWTELPDLDKLYTNFSK